MKSYNYERVGLMLKHINEREEKKVEPLELISFYLPSLYELNLVYNKTLKGKYHNISSEDYKIFHHQFIEDCKKDKK